MKNLVFVLCLSLVMSACSIIESHENTSKLVVQYAALKFVMNEDVSEREERAQKIFQVAKEGKALFDSRALPIEHIEDLVRERIDWDQLDAADTLLVNALIERIVIEVNESVLLGQDVHVTGSKILGWVIDGVRLSGLV